MLSIDCMFCGGTIRFEPKLKIGQKIVCPICLKHYEVVSITPLQVRPASNDFDAIWENPEKQARIKRMERRSKLDSDIDNEDLEEEMFTNGKASPRSAEKRNHRPKRIHGYAYDYDDEGMDGN